MFLAPTMEKRKENHGFGPYLVPSLCKLPSSCPPAWGTQGLFCTACCVSAGSGGSGGSAGSASEFREAKKVTTVLGFQHFLPENGVPFWAQGVPRVCEPGPEPQPTPNHPNLAPNGSPSHHFQHPPHPRTQNFEPDLAVIVPPPQSQLFFDHF